VRHEKRIGLSVSGVASVNGLKPSGVDQSLRRVAVVGRPNVGKSTLFNRLLGERRAITDPTPGVTRDAVEAVCRIAGTSVLLVDTGGYLADTEGVESDVADRSREHIINSDVVLLLVDVTGMTPEDEELIELVRTKAAHPILVVNKVDNEARANDAWNFHTLGFDHVVHISAEHRRNFQDLERAVVRELELSAAKPLEPRLEQIDIGIAILGKPNTGKSTLLNKLLDDERAIVSEVPGTTRDVIEGRFSYRNRTFLVLDTAGIRRKRSVSNPVEYYSVNRAIASVERADVVLLVVDATEGITDQDKKIASQVIRRGKGIVLVFNKWDLLSDVPNALNAVSDRARFVFPVLSFAPFLPVSAMNGTGLTETLDAVLRVHKQLKVEIGTGSLNRSLKTWSAEHPVPRGGGPRYVAKYMTQLSSNPLRFVLFVNRSRGFPASWVSYIRNRLREEYKLDQVPLVIELRES